jgi:hypothetical protein
MMPKLNDQWYLLRSTTLEFIHFLVAALMISSSSAALGQVEVIEACAPLADLQSVKSRLKVLTQDGETEVYRAEAIFACIPYQRPDCLACQRQLARDLTYLNALNDVSRKKLACVRATDELDDLPPAEAFCSRLPFIGPTTRIQAMMDLALEKCEEFRQAAKQYREITRTLMNACRNPPTPLEGGTGSNGSSGSGGDLPPGGSSGTTSGASGAGSGKRSGYGP